MDVEDDAVLERIARSREMLSAAEARVADLILTVPDLPLTMSMRALARRAGVSDATVLRFCRIFGFSGYSDFKLAVARESGPPSKKKIKVEGLGNASQRVVESARNVLAHVEQLVAVGELEHTHEVAKRIAAAEIVYVFAFGASTVAGWDFMHQLHYFGLEAAVLSDPHVQALRIESMTEQSVAIFLSIGYSRLLSEMAEDVAERGAYTVAVATPGTPLTGACQTTFKMSPDVSASLGPPVLGRNLQLAILDALAEEISRILGGGDRAQREIESRTHFNY